MKKNYIFFTLLFIAVCFSITAQSGSKRSIYVPYVMGTSIDPVDNYRVTDLLKMEVEARNYTLANSIRRADYLLVGTINPYRPKAEVLQEETVFFQWEIIYDPDDIEYHDDYDFYIIDDFDIDNVDVHEHDGAFEFRLQLINNNNKNEFVIEQSMIFYSFEEVLRDFPFAAFLFTIQEYDEAWDRIEDMWMYLGGSFFWSPRLYSGEFDSIYILNFGGGALIEIFISNYFAVGAGLEFVSDWIRATVDNEAIDVIMEVPVSLRFFFSPSAFSMLGAYGGVQFNYSIMNTTEPSPMSWLFGLHYGIKAGPGIFYIDPRYTADFRLSGRLGGLQYSRYSLKIGIGYKFGFFSK